MKKSFLYTAALATLGFASLTAFENAEKKTDEQKIADKFETMKTEFMAAQDSMCNATALTAAIEEFNAAQEAEVTEEDTKTTARKPRPKKPTNTVKPTETKPTETKPADGAAGRGNKPKGEVKAAGRGSKPKGEVKAAGRGDRKSVV